ncbi:MULTISPECIES: MbcA/ParS/Xre antitoxin family protein [unclassified Sulfitobacter]|uniref:MbcA/ParS/Xre antitoxin family protein n=1 Tax=unclassified Sulfitobacter TaxID=196795 RepID=UPI0025D175AC|nr:MbcA/ParS/Xre antitoxin family protein [Sulfitobacter sp.]
MTDFDIIERSRLSGPGLRAYSKIADLWELDEAQRIAALGDPDQSTYRNWMIRACAMGAVTLRQDALMRISTTLGIHKALHRLFSEHAQALGWLKSPHRGTAFQATTPLHLIVHGGQDGMMTVRRYLDRWSAGHANQGAPEGSFVPVTVEDVISL